jgi:hypothetical protein
MIYALPEDGGTRDGFVWFEEWCNAVYELTMDCGVKPLFDPFVVALRGNEHMIEELKQKGVDVRFCQFRGKDGCMIEWSKRPLVCKEWKCEKLDESDLIGENETVLLHNTYQTGCEES